MFPAFRPHQNAAAVAENRTCALELSSVIHHMLSYQGGCRQYHTWTRYVVPAVFETELLSSASSSAATRSEHESLMEPHG